MKVPDEIKCSACGGELASWSGQEVSRVEVSVVERKFVVLEHKLEKKHCVCGGCVVVAKAPDRLREGGRYGGDFATFVAINKYFDHLPLERLVRIMAREGLVTTSQALWDQIESLASKLAPAWQGLGAYQLTRLLLHVDETPWRMAKKGGEASR